MRASQSIGGRAALGEIGSAGVTAERTPEVVRYPIGTRRDEARMKGLFSGGLFLLVVVVFFFFTVLAERILIRGQ